MSEITWAELVKKIAKEKKINNKLVINVPKDRLHELVGNPFVNQESLKKAMQNE
jgi:hypothetical protein